MSLKDPAYDYLFGVMGKDLFVTGQATMTDGVSFDFEADLTSFMIDIKEESETNEKVLKYNKDAKQFVPGDFKVQVGDVRSTKIVSTETLGQVQSKL